MDSDNRQRELFSRADSLKRREQPINKEARRQQTTYLKFLASSEVSRAIERERPRIEETVTRQVTQSVDEAIRDLKDNDLNNLRSEIRQARNKILEPLSVFVGLFTFISIAFQMFSRSQEYILWMPTIVLILGALLLFAGLVIHASSLGSDDQSRMMYTICIGIIGLLLVFSAGYLYDTASKVLITENAKECVYLREASNEKNPVKQYCLRR